jgi:CHAT domain-containing protein/tetratricopeptide (TPR) repeat protein
MALFFGLVLMLVGQQGEALPKPTPEGTKALQALVKRCVEAGALKFGPRTEAGPGRLVVASAAALERLLRENRSDLSRPLCDALLTTSRSFDQSVLLEAVARLENDARMQAFAALARAESLAEEGNAPKAAKRYDEAARRFEALHFLGWQAKAEAALGSLLEAQGEFELSRKHYVKALHIVDRKQGKGSRDAAIARINLGSMEEKAGQPAGALGWFRDALGILEALPDAEPGDMQSVHRNLGGLLLASDPKAGLRHLEAALEWAEKVPAGDRRNRSRAAALANVGRAHQGIGQLERARERYEQARTILAGGGQDMQGLLAQVLDLLGAVHHDRRDRKACFEALTGAQQIRIALYGDRSWEVVHGFQQLGAARLNFGDFAQARQDYREAIRIAELLGGPRHPTVAEILGGLAEIAVEQGDDQQALELAEREHSICTLYRTTRPSALADSHNRLGKIQHRLGHDALAVSEFRAAIELWQKLPKVPEASVASGWQNLGLALARLREFDRAGAAIEKATGIREKLSPRNDSEIVSGLDALGSIRYDQGDYASALKAHTQAWEILRTDTDASAGLRAATLSNIGMSHFGLREWNKAAERFDEAIEALRARPRAANPDPETAQALYGFGPEDLIPTRTSAQVLYFRGMTRLRKGGADPSKEDLSVAAFSFASALSVLERLKVNEATTEAGRLALGRDLGDLDALLLGCYARLRERDKPGTEARALNDELLIRTADLGAARSLLISLARSRADLLADVPQSLRERRTGLLRELREVERSLEKSQSRPGLDRDFSGVEQLMHRRRQIERGLDQWRDEAERAAPGFIDWQSPRPCSLAQARDAIGPGAVALIYLSGAAESYLVAVLGRGATALDGEPITAVRLPRAREIAELVAAVIDEDRLASRRSVSARRDAYRMLVAPVAERIRDRALVIVPTGALCRLPFELLETQESGSKGPRYLVQDHALSYAPSLGVLRLIRQWETRRVGPDRVLLAAGDPVYGVKPGASAGDSLPRLEASRREIEAIAQTLGRTGTKVWLGPEASERALKALSEAGELARYRYVHLAVHGLPVIEDSRQPSLVFSLSEPGQSASEGATDDGYLRLDELLRLRMSADLVVFSACDSGLGQFHDGEGVFGLSQAALQAGTRGVICSLWRVADAPTSDLMADLYAALERGQPAAEALRSAQLKKIEAGEPPRYWAPFILIGR